MLVNFASSGVLTRIESSDVRSYPKADIRGWIFDVRFVPIADKRLGATKDEAAN
jgi:hypothetical protein